MKDLPTYEPNRFKREGWGKHRYSTPFPYSRLIRFLHSCVGEHLDEVFSKYSKTDWIPAVYRTYAEFKSRVEVDTFIQDGEIFYWEHIWKQEPKPVKGENRRNFFYIHPVSKLLIHKPHTGVQTWRKQEDERQKEYFRLLAPGHQLIKYKGIWYEYTFTVEEFTRGRYDPETGHCETVRRSQQAIDKDLTSPLYHPNGEDARFSRWRMFFPLIKDRKKRQLSAKELKAYGLTNTL